MTKLFSNSTIHTLILRLGEKEKEKEKESFLEQIYRHRRLIHDRARFWIKATSITASIDGVTSRIACNTSHFSMEIKPKGMYIYLLATLTEISDPYFSNPYQSVRRNVPRIQTVPFVNTLNSDYHFQITQHILHNFS